MRSWPHLLFFVCLLNPSGAAQVPAALPSVSRAAGPPPRPTLLQPLPLKNVQITDSFWSPKLRVYRERTLPHSWRYLEHELRALRKAAGETVQGELNGTWGEANLYKVLETAACSLAQFPDADLERKMDEIISLAARAQQPDGYLHAFVTNAKKQPWDPEFLDGSHDGYVLGHLLEAALEYRAATGKDNFLAIARKAADQAYQHFLGPRGRPGFCGHAELEMALIELFRVTAEQRYLDLARAFVEWRGRSRVKPASDTPRAYFQDALPLRQQRTLEGHAVRAVFFATGVADLALETGDCDYRLAAHRFWNSTAHRRMTITGSIGPRREHEALGEDYELPNDGYYESCAACGLADFAQRMFLLEARAHYADVLERVLYNAVLHGISLDGTNTYYQNPLSDRDNPRYNSWVCCPPNLSRTLFQVGRYAIAHGDRDIYVNLFVGGAVAVPLTGGLVRFEVQTEYPWDGTVTITAHPAQPLTFALHLRQPGWCDRLELKVNGQSIQAVPRTDNGYVRLDREWHAGDVVSLRLDMPVQRIQAHPNIQDCAGKVALQRGPIVYALEGLDNNGQVRIALGADSRCTTEHRPEFLGGVTVIRGGSDEGQPFLAIPFFALANRARSSQEVWLTQRGLKPDRSWWEGNLYRPMPPAQVSP